MTVAVRARISNGAIKSRVVLDPQEQGVFRRFAASHFMQLTCVKSTQNRLKSGYAVNFGPSCHSAYFQLG